MDLEDEVLLMWENDASLLHYEIASSVESYSDNQKSYSNDEIFLKRIDEDLDYAFALSLQTQYEEELIENENNNSKDSVPSLPNKSKSKPLSIVDDQWELIDPHPDIHALFLEFDTKFFYGKLKHVEVRWSPRMTLCAGVCSYEGRGGLCSIRLSVPLLKLRPRRDLVETLLHEMIHAYLFVTHNNKDREGHGPEFLSHMNRINKETGTRISVYHSFHDEVDLYRQHWWKCDGPCQKRQPFFGIVRRAMNRVPGPKDKWWTAHQSSCGGKFIKIKEPEDFKKKKAAKRKISPTSASKESDIRNFLKDNNSASNTSNRSNSAAKSSRIFDFKSIAKEKNVSIVNPTKTPAKNFIPFQGTGVKLGASSRGVVYNESDLSCSALGKVIDVANSRTPKFSEVSISSGARDVYKGLAASTSNVPKRLIQSPIEKFLTSKFVSDNTSDIQKNINQSNIHNNVQGSDTVKVSCPVCFIKVTEEYINSHLDKCLNN